MMEFMDEEMIGSAVEVEKMRLASEVEKGKLAVEELVKKKKLTEEELEQIRDMRRKFVLHISPLEIIQKGDEDFIDVVAQNVNQIELVIYVTYHYYIYQYWSPPPTTTTTTTTSASAAATTTANSSSSSLACQHHHDYHHPRDDDDEDMILTSCRPLCDPPQKFKIILRQGVFAAAISSDDDDHTTALLGDLDVLLEHNVVIRRSELQDLKTSIAHSISSSSSSEAKAAAATAAAHVRDKPLPKRVRICCDVSRVTKQYFGSAEAATFAAVEDDAEEADASEAYFSYIFD